ncbi:uncharacterized protein BYT42DRAFT_398746 [Radiomyces spectabilis]|uniref:uncharacterized protein n=1 Tax=Radiomyces spectabilis TaxID=64574 RepID=UPI00221EEE07|nr:uncharacterized protein BYT42DRAFT_398746 [Radiomyces spectabilis]KAI8374291.1 hypothetical protein BYT42DRAFT_398746 [Radiomyces spectabilis]
MAKGRSAISKNMAKKASKPSGSHVSGLSSAKPSKRKDATLKYGQLSRKQKQDLMDYGELVPKDFELDQNDDDEEGAPSKRRRVIDEADLDRELEEEAERMERQFDSDEEPSEADDEEDEDDWEKPSAYSLLIGSLKKSSQQKDFYKKIEREQEGYEDMADDQEEEEEVYEEEDDLEEVDEVEDIELNEEDEDLEGSEQDDDEDDQEDLVEDKDAVDPEDNLDDEEEMFELYGSSDDEATDTVVFEERLADAQPKDFDEKVAKIEQKKWVTQAFEDDLLKDVVCYTTGADKSIKEKEPITDLKSTGMKERIANCWQKANQSCLKEGQSSKPFTPLQERLFNHIHRFRDVMYCNRTVDNAKEIRNIYALHAMNHVTKTRNRVLKNNAKLARAQRENKEIGDLRDQGFTRPKVLIVLPFRNTVVDVVNTLIKISGTDQQDNKKRFYDQFNLLEQDEMDENKPADFLETFRGNIDDHFRLAIKFTKKTMKLYCDFYSADIIIASPLGLRTMIGSEGDTKRDFDFLSSIELLILDQTSHFLMQNWDHIDHLFQYMNLIPADAHGMDISRIKSWYLDGKARYLRQTLVFSDFLTPELNAMFTKYLKNVSGKMKIKQQHEGSIMDVIPQVQQTFTRIDTTSLAAMDDARFKYFVDKTLPTLRKSAITQSHTLIFIPSYFDFVRLRNFFEDNKYDYEPCCEYTSGSGIARARAQFFHGRTNFLLYTERLHFFRR